MRAKDPLDARAADSHPVPNGFVSLMGALTASVSNTTMGLVEDGTSLGCRQLDMGNSCSEVDPTVNLFSLSKSVSCEIPVRTDGLILASKDIDRRSAYV